MNQLKLIRISKESQKYITKLIENVCISNNISVPDISFINSKDENISQFARFIYQIDEDKPNVILNPRIEASDKLYSFPPQVIDLIIKHEICHYMVAINIGSERGHNKDFMDYCHKLEIPFMTSLGFYMAGSYKINCSNCNRHLYTKNILLNGHKTTIPKFTKNYKCPNCNSQNINVYKIPYAVIVLMVNDDVSEEIII